MISEEAILETLLILDIPLGKAREAAHVLHRQILTAEIAEHARTHNKEAKQ